MINKTPAWVVIDLIQLTEIKYFKSEEEARDFHSKLRKPQYTLPMACASVFTDDVDRANETIGDSQ